MKQRIAQAVRGVLVSTTVLALIISWVFGFEPQVANFDTHLYHNFTFEEYMQASIAQNGDTAWIRALTIVAYPGARAGRFAHNALVAKQ